MSLLFVYGSLKQGFPNTHVNTGRRRPGTFRTVQRLPLYLLGEGHVPCLVLSPGVGHQVRGEVYEVDASSRSVMDRLERLGESDGYQRVTTEVEAIGTERPEVLTVEVYVKTPEQVTAEMRRIGPLVEYTNEHATRFSWQGLDTIDPMVDYYQRRAETYERVYHKPERQSDLREMESWIARTFGGRRVLELACGTGWWTPHGARNAAHWLATDLTPATMDIARRKALPACVDFATVDAYTLEGLDPAMAFDAAFAGFWWSHVPLQRVQPWLATLHARLPSGARVVFLDNSFVQTSNLPITRRDDDGNTYQTRSLDDGSVHEVLKNFPTPAQVQANAGPRAGDFSWTAWTHYWAATWTLA